MHLFSFHIELGAQRGDLCFQGISLALLFADSAISFSPGCQFSGRFPGFLGGPGEREKLGMIGGGPNCVVSTMGVYLFDEKTKEMYLSEYFPGQSVEKIKANCAWDLKVSPKVKETTIPTAITSKTLAAVGLRSR